PGTVGFTMGVDPLQNAFHVQAWDRRPRPNAEALGQQLGQRAAACPTAPPLLQGMIDGAPADVRLLDNGTTAGRGPLPRAASMRPGPGQHLFNGQGRCPIAIHDAAVLDQLLLERGAARQSTRPVAERIINALPVTIIAGLGPAPVLGKPG